MTGMGEPQIARALGSPHALSPESATANGFEAARAFARIKNRFHAYHLPDADLVGSDRDCILTRAAGSTTLIAAEKTGRRACAMDLDPNYIQTAIRRWERYSGKSAILAKTGQTLQELVETGRSIDEPVAVAAAAPMETRHG